MRLFFLCLLCRRFLVVGVGFLAVFVVVVMFVVFLVVVYYVTSVIDH